MSSKENGQTKMEGVVENWNSQLLKIKASDGKRGGRNMKFLVRGTDEWQEVP